jgi:ribosomal protein S18 acetylase RimI-like enzyme
MVATGQPQHRRLRAVLCAIEQPRTDHRSSGGCCHLLNNSVVAPATVRLRNEGDRAAPLPGTQLTGCETVIRQLEPRDADAYVAFAKRMLWRESWHYPMRTEADARAIAERGGSDYGEGGGSMWLVLVETRREAYGGNVYAWDEIWGEAWYGWREGSEHSTFGLCINNAFQGSGAGRTLMARVLEVADLTDIGPPVMRLSVQNLNERAWQLYESMGFVKLPKLTKMVPERTSKFFDDGRKSPPMEDWHYQRRCQRTK